MVAGRSQSTHPSTHHPALRSRRLITLSESQSKTQPDQKIATLRIYPGADAVESTATTERPTTTKGQLPVDASTLSDPAGKLSRTGPASHSLRNGSRSCQGATRDKAALNRSCSFSARSRHTAELHRTNASAPKHVRHLARKSHCLQILPKLISIHKSSDRRSSPSCAHIRSTPFRSIGGRTRSYPCIHFAAAYCARPATHHVGNAPLPTARVIAASCPSSHRCSSHSIST